MVVVMTNFNNLGSCTLFDGSCYAQDLTGNVIPFVEAHFNVSHDGNDRAFAGLSLGGLMANFLLFNDTTVFGYLGSWSIADIGAPPTTSPLWQNPALKTRLGLEIGGGNFDSLTVPAIDTYEAELGSAGDPVPRRPGGRRPRVVHVAPAALGLRHRRGLPPHDDQRRDRPAGQRATASVAGDTTEPVSPFGTVQFLINGDPVGRPVPLRWGRAALRLHRSAAGGSVTAVYSGDHYYNASTSPAVPVS